MSIKLFAYGTLRHGSAPAEIAKAVATLRPIGRGVAPGWLYDLGVYPGAVFGILDPKAGILDPKTGILDPMTGIPGFAAAVDPGCKDIEGEVYEVPDSAALRQLDAYEGFELDNPAASLFVRRQIDVSMIESGERFVCWAYEYNRPARVPDRPADIPLIAS